MGGAAMIRRALEALAVAAVLAFPLALYFYNMTP
jgi:hypothetical protein